MTAPETPSAWFLEAFPAVDRRPRGRHKAPRASRRSWLRRWFGGAR